MRACRAKVVQSAVDRRQSELRHDPQGDQGVGASAPRLQSTHLNLCRPGSSYQGFQHQPRLAYALGRYIIGSARLVGLFFALVIAARMRPTDSLESTQPLASDQNFPAAGRVCAGRNAVPQRTWPTSRPSSGRDRRQRDRRGVYRSARRFGQSARQAMMLGLPAGTRVWLVGVMARQRPSGANAKICSLPGESRLMHRYRWRRGRRMELQDHLIAPTVNPATKRSRKLL